MHNLLSRWMTRFWYSNSIVAYLLWPFSLIYLLIISLRRLAYSLGWLPTQRFPVPIIIVGNITVGGTGKTPLVIWLANYLRAQGYQPGIVSRGYGGKKCHYPHRVAVNDNPQRVGDEALLLARKTQCPVMIDPKRPRAVAKLLATTTVNIIICDDGLQHYALGRDLEIAVIDSNRGCGNSFCLPAGPLRELPNRLKQVDFVVFNGSDSTQEFCMKIKPGMFHQVNDAKVTQLPEYFKNSIVHALAGIGNPERFFGLLQSLGLCLVEHVFPDHYVFQITDINFEPERPVIMTEKDAVKCESFADARYWYLAIEAELSDAFSRALLEKLRNCT